MNYRKLNKLSSLYFGAILAVGVTYWASISWIFLKTLPGTLMLMVYFLDSRKYGYGLESYGAMSQLWVSLGLWLLSLTLILRTLVAGLKMIRMIGKTRKFVGGLKIVSQTGKRVVFDSESGEIFTAGLWSPKIYVANGLRKMHTAKELRAMVMHEENHTQSKDPLRTALVMMIERSLPGFPWKAKLAGYFYTLVEVCADKKAEERLKNRRPLITALYKRLAVGSRAISAGIIFFNSHSERIGLLVGNRKLNKNVFFGMVYVTITGVAVFSYLVTQVNFYNCPHLAMCLSAITSVLELH